MANPQGKHQIAIMAQLRKQPQNTYPLPKCVTNEGIAQRLAIRRLADKGLVTIDGDRYAIVR